MGLRDPHRHCRALEGAGGVATTVSLCIGVRVWLLPRPHLHLGFYDPEF